MKKFLFVLALLHFISPIHSQSVEIGTTLNIQTERLRIEAQRRDYELHYAQEEAACHARFAVTDCLQEVRVRRRESLDDLHRQDLLLKAVERQRRTLQQMERIKEKSSDRTLEGG